MTTKVFAERGKTQLVGDARGFTVPWQCRQEYWQWCQNNNIVTEYQGSLDHVDLWYIKNDEHRVLALLRWS